MAGRTSPLPSPPTWGRISGTLTDQTDLAAELATYLTDVSTDTLTNKTLDSFTNDIEADAVHVEVRNESGSTLVRGTPVYVSGYSIGQDVILVSAANASTSATMPVIGLLQNDIANNASGACLVNGRLKDVDTSAFSSGDILYASSTAGQLTTTRPTGAQIVQQLGEVLRSHASMGVILIDRSKTTRSGLGATLIDAGTAAVARGVIGALAATDITSGTITAGTGDIDFDDLGGGDVSKVGTPADNQLAVWTGDGTLEGDSNLTWDGGSVFTISNAGTAWIKATRSASNVAFLQLSESHPLAGLQITNGNIRVLNGLGTVSFSSGTNGLDINGKQISFASIVGFERTTISSAIGIAVGSSDTAVFLRASNSVVGKFTTSGVEMSYPVRLGLYTFATVPAASAFQHYEITISDRASRSAYSDGTNWRFVADDAIIS